MFRLLILVALQTLFLSGGNVLLKKGVAQLPPFQWSKTYFMALIQDYWFLACGISFGIASLLWLFILRHFPFSQAYPLTALAYVFGLLASIFFLGESVPAVRIVGVALIVIGCVLVMK